MAGQRTSLGIAVFWGVVDTAGVFRARACRLIPFKSRVTRV